MPVIDKSAVVAKFITSLTAGLRHKSITSVSKWSETYRIIQDMLTKRNGTFNFSYHPWTRDVCDCDSQIMVAQKAAQMGFTETAINKTFAVIDMRGWSVLYVLPTTKPDATDFSTSRFDPALEQSPHIAAMFTDTRNIGHKRAGNANLFIRGSRSRSQMKSLPVSLLVADEVDEMDQDNLVLAFERTSGQMVFQHYLLSTPTIKGRGINRYFENSTQEHFFFRCPHCSQYVELVYPDCLVITVDSILDPKISESHIICSRCRAPLAHDDKINIFSTGKWIPTYPDRTMRGFTISQLYSITQHPASLAEKFLLAQRNPADEQELYNSKLGIPHETEGSRITDALIEGATGNYKRLDCITRRGAFITMGVDVGKLLHVEITQWSFDANAPTADINLLAHGKVLEATTVEQFADLADLIRRFSVIYSVIDYQPETRSSLQFCQQFYGHAKMCHYSVGPSGKQIASRDDDEYFSEHMISLNRTSWMDMSLGRFKNKTIQLPFDISHEYKEQLKAPTRVLKKDRQGNMFAVYLTPDNMPDHYAHARTYCEIALALGVCLARSENIYGLL